MVEFCISLFFIIHIFPPVFEKFHLAGTWISYNSKVFSAKPKKIFRVRWKEFADSRTGSNEGIRLWLIVMVTDGACRKVSEI